MIKSNFKKCSPALIKYIQDDGSVVAKIGIDIQTEFRLNQTRYHFIKKWT